MKSSLWLKVFLVLLGSIFGLLALELLVSLLHLAPTAGVVSLGRFQLSTNPLLGYEPRPQFSEAADQRSDIHMLGGFHEVSNSLGFRDIDHSIRKPPGATRIVFIGDSLTMGWGIPERADIYVDHLARSLRDAGRKVDVINMGVSGYNSEQEVEILRVRGLDFEPDIVVLQYCLNDEQDPWPANRIFTERLLERRAPNLGALITESMEHDLLMKSGLYRYMKYVVFKAGVINHSKQLQRLTSNTVHQSFAKLKQLSSEHNFRALVAVFPTAALDSPEDTRTRNRIIELAQHEGLEAVDLLEAFKNCSGDGSLFIDHFHPTARGHRCAGAALLPYIIKSLR